MYEKRIEELKNFGRYDVLHLHLRKSILCHPTLVVNDEVIDQQSANPAKTTPIRHDDRGLAPVHQ
jgi:hypothetical protein